MIRRLKERCRSDTPTGEEEATAPTEVAVAAASAVTAVRPATETKVAASRQNSFSEGIKVGSNFEDGATGDSWKLGIGRDVSPGKQGDDISRDMGGGQQELVPVKLTSRDILLGRGRTIQELPSSMHFRELVSSYRTKYDKAKRIEKRAIVHKIIGTLRSEGYRFCKRIGDDVGDMDSNKKLSEYRWVLADPEEIYKKISHNLRSTRRSSNLEQPDSKHPSKITSVATTKASRGEGKQQKSATESFLSFSPLSQGQVWFEAATAATGAGGSVSSVRSSQEDVRSVTSNAAIERAVSELNAVHGISFDRGSASSASLDGGQYSAFAERMPKERGGHKRISKTKDEEGTNK